MSGIYSLFVVCIVLVFTANAQDSLNPPDQFQVAWRGTTNFTGCKAGTNYTYLTTPHWYNDLYVKTSMTTLVQNDLSSTGISISIAAPYIPQKFRWMAFAIPVGADTTVFSGSFAYGACSAGCTTNGCKNWIQGDPDNPFVAYIGSTALDQYTAGTIYPYYGLVGGYWSVPDYGNGNCDTQTFVYNITYNQLVQCSTTDSKTYIAVSNTTNADSSVSVSMNGQVMLVAAGYYVDPDTGGYLQRFTRYYVPWQTTFRRGMAVNTNSNNFLRLGDLYSTIDMQNNIYVCTSGIFSVPSTNSVINTTDVTITATVDPGSWYSNAVAINQLPASRGMSHYFRVCVSATCTNGYANCSGNIPLTFTAKDTTSVPAVQLETKTLSISVPAGVRPVRLNTRWKINTSSLTKLFSNGSYLTPSLWEDGDRMYVTATASSASCSGSTGTCTLDPTGFYVRVYRAALCFANATVTPTITNDDVTGCYTMPDYTTLVDEYAPIATGTAGNYYKPATVSGTSATASMSVLAKLFFYSGSKSVMLNTPKSLQYLHLIIDVTYRGTSSKRSILVPRSVSSDTTDPALYAFNIAALAPPPGQTSTTGASETPSGTNGNTVSTITGKSTTGSSIHKKTEITYAQITGVVFAGVFFVCLIFGVGCWLIAGCKKRKVRSYHRMTTRS
jgi:hypothetical protein